MRVGCLGTFINQMHLLLTLSLLLAVLWTQPANGAAVTRGTARSSHIHITWHPNAADEAGYTGPSVWWAVCSASCLLVGVVAGAYSRARSAAVSRRVSFSDGEEEEDSYEQRRQTLHEGMGDLLKEAGKRRNWTNNRTQQVIRLMGLRTDNNTSNELTSQKSKMSRSRSLRSLAASRIQSRAISRAVSVKVSRRVSTDALNADDGDEECDRIDHERSSGTALMLKEVQQQLAKVVWAERDDEQADEQASAFGAQHTAFGFWKRPSFRADSDGDDDAKQSLFPAIVSMCSDHLNRRSSRHMSHSHSRRGSKAGSRHTSRCSSRQISRQNSRRRRTSQDSQEQAFGSEMLPCIDYGGTPHGPASNATKARLRADVVPLSLEGDAFMMQSPFLAASSNRLGAAPAGVLRNSSKRTFLRNKSGVKWQQAGAHVDVPNLKPQPNNDGPAPSHPISAQLPSTTDTQSLTPTRTSLINRAASVTGVVFESFRNTYSPSGKIRPWSPVTVPNSGDKPAPTLGPSTTVSHQTSMAPISLPIAAWTQDGGQVKDNSGRRFSNTTPAVATVAQAPVGMLAKLRQCLFCCSFSRHSRASVHDITTPGNGLMAAQPTLPKDCVQDHVSIPIESAMWSGPTSPRQHGIHDSLSSFPTPASSASPHSNLLPASGSERLLAKNTDAWGTSRQISPKVTTNGGMAGSPAGATVRFAGVGEDGSNRGLQRQRTVQGEGQEGGAVPDSTPSGLHMLLQSVKSARKAKEMQPSHALLPSESGRANLHMSGRNKLKPLTTSTPSSGVPLDKLLQATKQLALASSNSGTQEKHIH